MQVNFGLVMRQKLQNIPIKTTYLPELSGLRLNLKDADGNNLTLYKSDYLKLCDILKTQGKLIKTMSPEDLMREITAINSTMENAHQQIQVIKYFTPQTLQQYKLDNSSSFAPESAPFTAGTVLKRAGHQNCVVMDKHNHIFMHPKVRPVMARNEFGVNHSSLALQKTVAFAGSFIHSEDKGWVIENTTGHYGTYVIQMRNFLEQLQKTGVKDFDKITVKLWIPLKSEPGVDEADYDIRYENATDFLHRTSQSFSKITEQLNVMEVSTVSSNVDMDSLDLDVSEASSSMPTPRNAADVPEAISPVANEQSDLEDNSDVKNNGPIKR